MKNKDIIFNLRRLSNDNNHQVGTTKQQQHFRKIDRNRSDRMLTHKPNHRSIFSIINSTLFLYSDK